MEVRMAEKSVWCFIFLLTLLEVVVKTKMTVHGNSHAFMQANNEVRYLVDGVPISMHNELSGASGVRVPSLEDNSLYNSKANLKFDPPILDFKERHLGMPHHEKVTLFNTNSNKTIHMSSISGNTVHFHSSFFEDKIIPPLGNTTFNVVFLGREEGVIESNLFIHTSEGSFKYQVKGASVTSPYRLRPLVGVHVPLNATYSPLVYMHNPHTTHMQIVEVYSSGGDFHLELPSGELEGPKHLWEIPPYHTKPFIRIRFLAKTEKNHTAYIRVKVNKSEEVLVVPLEVEVGPNPGLYSPEDVVDFGLGGSQDKPRQMKLYLYNSWKKAIRIQNIITMPVSKALKIDFQPIKVPPDPKVPTQVAVLTFDWKSAFESQQYSGKLVIKSKQTHHKLVIPYSARVLEGGLGYNASVTQYCADLGTDLGPRNFTVSNGFRVPAALVNVTLARAAHLHFLIQQFKPVVLSPGESTVVFQLAVRKATILSELKLESYLTLHTNVSTVEVPLLCYNGRLVMVIPSSPEESELNFGTVGSHGHKELHFALLNNNPVSVEVQACGTNLTRGAVELLGVQQGNSSAVLQRYSFANLTASMMIEPGHYAVFRVLVTTSRSEEELEGEVHVQTQFERIRIPARLRVAHGSLEMVPESLILQDCFPGKLCSQQLHMRSLFSRSMAVTSITSVPPDPRVGYHSQGPGLDYQVAHISPLATSSIGQLTFNPGLGCGTHCYLGIPNNYTVGNQWLHTLSLPMHTLDSDSTLLSVQYSRYVAQPSWHNVSLRLDTTEVRGHTLEARVRLSWPHLLSNSSSLVDFPLTQIGNTTYQELSICNPSMRPLVVQLVLDWSYPHGRRLIDRLPHSFRPKCVDCPDSTPGEFMWAGSSQAAADLEARLGVVTHQDSLPLIIEPGETVRARLGFTPNKPGSSSVLVYLRNNMTIVEVVRVTGQAAQAQFKFGNRKPGSGTPLLFELAEKHLKDCEREKDRKFPAPNLTVKRSFTARNTGELPIHVSSFSINGLACEGFGFRILNCEPFLLPPNGTRKIDIAFTPDFTLARVQRTLIIETSLGLPVNYTLVTTLPPFFLASCSALLGRPSWEPLLYYSAISFMTFLLFCVTAAAFLESDRILKCAFITFTREKQPPPVRQPFDLKQVAANATRSMENKTKPEAEWNATTQHDKHNTSSSSNSSSSSSNNSSHSNNNKQGSHRNHNGWSAEERRILSEIDTKDKLHSAKYEEAESGFSNHTTPPLPAKSKKKLSKKNSNASETSSVSEPLHEASLLKKGWDSVFPRQGRSGKAAPDTEQGKPARVTSDVDHGPAKKTKEPPVEEKKPPHRSKKNNKCVQETVPCSEEETSSTTTESSNNEEVEKERETCTAGPPVRPSKPPQKKGYEADWDCEEYKRRDAGACRWKANSFKSGKNGHEPSHKTELLRPPSLELPYKLKSSKNGNRERKEKKVLNKRLVEKNDSHKGAAVTESTTSAPVRTSPPLRNCWGEHRATFSDVVARNDSPLYSNIVAPRQPPPPVKSAIPSTATFSADKGIRKQEQPRVAGSTLGLGPIGSKKPVSEAWESYLQQPQFLRQQDPNSLFLDSFSEPPKPRQAEESIGGLQGYSNIWEQQHLLHEANKRQAEESQRQTLFRENWPASLWHPLYTPAVGDGAPYTEQPNDSVWSSLVSSVWSSSLWSAAPGAVPTHHQTLVEPLPHLVSAAPEPIVPEEDNTDIDRGLGFDPFRSLNNIWSPRLSDPWNPTANK